MTETLRDLARAKATFQARSLRAILTTKGKPMKDKAPERIWAYTNDGYGDRMTDHGRWDTGIEGQPDCHSEWPHAPYVRADLAPIPAPDHNQWNAAIEAAAHYCENLRGLGLADASLTGPMPVGKVVALGIRALKKGSPAPDVRELEAENARLRGVLREVLRYEGQKASNEGDCTCMNWSRDTERAYETGQCVHQRARAALAIQYRG